MMFEKRKALLYRKLFYTEQCAQLRNVKVAYFLLYKNVKINY